MHRVNENAKAARLLTERKATCLIKTYGGGMSPLIKAGQLAVTEPVTEDTVIGRDDIVFCKVGARYCLRKVTEIPRSGKYKVSCTGGRSCRTIGRENIFGLVVRVLG